MASDKLPRLTWCVTGPLTFFPLHAAGLYSRTSLHIQKRIFDFVVTSYTPSLSILLPRRDINRGPLNSLRVLAVSQPATSGYSKLPGTEDEVCALKECVGDLTWLDHEQ